jgi:hypothetical protein
MGVRQICKSARRSTYLWTLPASLLAALLLAIAALSSDASPAPVRPRARVASGLSVSWVSNMHLVGRPGHTLNESGTVSGTVSGSIYSRGEAITTNIGTATFTIWIKGGSISGRAGTHGHIVGATAYFYGTALITAGSGRLAHAVGSHLRFSGTLNRQNYRVNEHISGTLG